MPPSERGLSEPSSKKTTDQPCHCVGSPHGPGRIRTDVLPPEQCGRVSLCATGPVGWVWRIPAYEVELLVKTLDSFGMLHVFKAPQPAVDDPEHLRLLVETRTGLRVDEDGMIQRLSQAEWQKRRGQLAQFEDSAG